MVRCPIDEKLSILFNLIKSVMHLILSKMKVKYSLYVCILIQIY